MACSASRGYLYEVNNNKTNEFSHQICWMMFDVDVNHKTNNATHRLSLPVPLLLTTDERCETRDDDQGMKRLDRLSSRECRTSSNCFVITGSLTAADRRRWAID